MLVHNNEHLHEGAVSEINKIFVAADAPGQVLWNPDVGDDGPVPDAMVFLEEHCRLALTILTPRYSVDGRRWRVHDSSGATPTPDPVESAWKASQAVRRALDERIQISPYVIPVVIFANMEKDAAILDSIGWRKVKLLWGIDDLVNRLAELPDEDQIRTNLSAEFIDREVAALMGEHGDHAPRSKSKSPVNPDDGAMDLAGGGVYMAHVDQVVINIRLGPDS